MIRYLVTLSLGIRHSKRELGCLDHVKSELASRQTWWIAIRGEWLARILPFVGGVLKPPSRGGPCLRSAAARRRRARW